MQKRQPTPIENVFRYPNGTLYYRRGKIEESLQTTSLDEARKRKTLLEDRILKYGFQSFKATFSGLTPAFLKHLEDRVKGRGNRKLRQSSFVQYERQWRRHVLPHFGKLKLARFDEFIWKKTLDNIEVYDKVPVKSVMTIFLTWAKSERQVSRKFDLEVERPKRREREIATPEQLTYIIKHTNGRLFAWLIIKLLCGKRGNEVRTLKWSDIDMDRMAIKLREENVKTGKAREIPFNESVKEVLLQMKDEAKTKGVKSEYVFFNNRDPKRPGDRSSFEVAWIRFRARHEAVSNLTPHDLRSTFETYLNTRTDFTDTQKEKYVGATMKQQSKTYVKFKAEDLRGIEDTIQVEGLDALITKRVQEHKKP